MPPKKGKKKGKSPKEDLKPNSENASKDSVGEDVPLSSSNADAVITDITASSKRPVVKEVRRKVVAHRKKVYHMGYASNDGKIETSFVEDPKPNPVKGGEKEEDTTKDSVVALESSSKLVEPKGESIAGLVKVEGADVGESSSDFHVVQQLKSEDPKKFEESKDEEIKAKQVSVSKKEESSVPKAASSLSKSVDEESAVESNVVNHGTVAGEDLGIRDQKPRRNLVPGGMENGMEQDSPEMSKPNEEGRVKLTNDALDKIDPTADDKVLTDPHPEEKMERGAKGEEMERNLTPTGSGDGVEQPQSELTSPEEKDEVKTGKDVNENPIVEDELLGGKEAAEISGDDNELPWAMYRNLEKNERASDAEDELSDDDDDDEEGAFNGPPGTSSIPELYEYLGSLDNGDTELEAKGIPPSLFGTEQQQDMHKGINKTKLALAEEEIGWYLEEFEKHVEEEVLMIGNIGLGEVQEEERHIREEHTAYQKAQAQIQRNKKQELASAMERAKKHVMEVFREKYGRVKNKEAALMRRDRRVQGQITKAFRRSENQLLKALRKRKSEVLEMYGDLVFADQEFGGAKGKRWKVDWDKAQQPIQIKLKCLRSVRDKLPLSEYVLMVSLYSRLGGHVMKWSNLKGQKWGAVTLPLMHDGEFYNTELKIDQSVFTACPSKPDMRPGMVLMFELFILHGPVAPGDEVIAWGCFPICDGTFSVVEGKYKTALMRGNIDPSITIFQSFEEMVAFDLEHWLCNMYFEIIKLPRYLMEQKEYEVELQFTSSLVSYPIRTKTGEEFVDGEQPIYGSTADLSSILASRASMPNSRANSYLNLNEESNDHKPSAGNKIKLTVEPPQRKTSKPSRPSSAVSMSMKLQKAADISTELRQRRSSRSSAAAQPLDDNASLKLSMFGSRKSMAFSDESDNGSGTDYNDDDVCIVKKDPGFRKVKGREGMYYKVHQNNPVDVYSRKLLNTLPQTVQPSARRKKKKLTHQDDLRQHTYSVRTLWSGKGHLPRRGREKMQYIMRMMLAELGLSQWRKGQFWITVFMLLITWFMRMYLHYFGQWVLLKGLSIPINKFNFHAYTVELNYQATLLQTRHELGVIMAGPFTDFIFFLLSIPLTLLFQKLFRWFPDVITHFILAFGLQTFLDPLWTLIVDCALGRYDDTGGEKPIGDAFKLYWHFNRNYSNKDVTLYVSISMTVFLYVVVAFCTAALWYMFFIRLHNNGRMMDVYWRLHGTEEEFFLPYDLEVSNEELNFICRKAEQWRGEEGERRKVAVYDYVWEQEELAHEQWGDPDAHGEKTGAKEITTHVSIHSIHPDGLIELHRQFLKLPDGAIVEVFGEMNMPGIDEGVKEELLKRTRFQGASNTAKRNRSISVTSIGSAVEQKRPLRRMSSNRLDVPM